MVHSTSLRPIGSLIVPSILVASSWRFLPTRSMACLTAARSSGDVAEVVAGGKDAAGGIGARCGNICGNIGACNAGGVAPAGMAETGVTGAAGAIDSGADFDGFCA